MAYCSSSLFCGVYVSAWMIALHILFSGILFCRILLVNDCACEASLLEIVSYAISVFAVIISITLSQIWYTARKIPFIRQFFTLWSRYKADCFTVEHISEPVFPTELNRECPMPVAIFIAPDLILAEMAPLIPYP